MIQDEANFESMRETAQDLARVSPCCARSARRYTSIAIVAAVFVVAACATTQFDRALNAHRWSDAASAFDADTALQHDETALFRAAMLYTFPTRATYDPERARELFRKFLALYPDSPNRQQAIDQLALLEAMQRVETVSDQRVRDLQNKIAQIALDTVHLHARLDSIAVRLQAEQDQSALLRKVTTRLESDLQDRETQLRALNDELNHLKEIDLKPSVKAKSEDKSDRVKTVPVH
jgi:hypothetical protein